MPKGIYLHKLHTEAWKKANSERMKGKKYSLGYKHTDETKLKMSLARKGEKHPMYGKHHSEQTKKKLSEFYKGKLPKHLVGYWTGRKQTEEHKAKSLKSLAINPHRFKKGMVAPTKGKNNYKIAKENHYNWQGGITPVNKQIRNSLEYKLWRESVFKRDNWTCVWCGFKGYVIADHIKPFALYPELRFAIDNGRTLCVPCHRTTETFGGRISKLIDKK